MKYFIALLLSLFLVSCDTKVSSVKRYDNVTAVWFHEGNQYSISVIEDGMLQNIRPYVHIAEVHVDLKQGERPWAVVTRGYRPGDSSDVVLDMEIHISSINDVNSAGWDHGKFGSGKTERID